MKEEKNGNNEDYSQYNLDDESPKNEEKKNNEINYNEDIKKDKQEIKFENKHSFEEIETKDALNQVLYISVNSNNNILCLGTMTGFKLFSLVKLSIELIYQYQFEPCEPIKLIEILDSTPLLFIVGKNESQFLSPKKITLFDLKEKKIIHSLRPQNSDIKLVKLNRKRIIVYADDTIYIYNLQNMNFLHAIKIDDDFSKNINTNYLGQICLSPNSDNNNYLIYSSSQLHGLIKIYDVLYLNYVNFIQAHRQPVFKMCINSKGNLIASCSLSNSSIKIFTIPDGEQLFKFERIYTSNIITGMNFNTIGADKLVVSSSGGNIHIFDLDKPSKKNEQNNMKVNGEGYLDKINQIYQKVAKECKEYINNKNLKTTVNVKDLKGKNLLFFKEGKGVDNKNFAKIIALNMEGFFWMIDIDIKNFSVENIYKKYIDSLKLKKSN